MKIVLTAGGSGGHITPLLAVAAEFKRKYPKSELIYIGQHGDKLGDIPAADPNIDAVYTVRAGKFRRYHGEGLKQLLDLPTMFKNFRDFFYVLIGIWQSRRLMKRLRPAVVFSRGGFVSVPVALGATMCHVPYITHDSDRIPSLANRIIARWAAWHAVALPKELYPYDQAKTSTTGIPLNKAFVPVTAQRMKQYRTELKLPVSAKVLFIIGGGLGSQTVNLAVAEAVPHLLKEFPDLVVVHVVGRDHEEVMTDLYGKRLPAGEQQRVRVLGFIADVYRYSGAADVVITRAGATNLAEFAVQGKACIVVPSSFLSGGHQLHNAQYLADEHAAAIVSEEDLAADPNRLAKQVSHLLHTPAERQALGRGLARFAKPNATEELVDLIIRTANKHTQNKQANYETETH